MLLKREDAMFLDDKIKIVKNWLQELWKQSKAMGVRRPHLTIREGTDRVFWGALLCFK